MEIRRMKISADKLNALKVAISKLGDVTFDKTIDAEAGIEAIMNNRSCYYSDMARIKALQNARSAILDEYEKAFDASNIGMPVTQVYPVTVLEVQLDQEAEDLLKVANEAESRFLNQLF